jgi:hypothetical protein
MRSIDKKNNIIFPVIVIVASLKTIFTIIQYPVEFYGTVSVIYGIISVIVGVMGVVLFYKHNNAYDKLFYIWIFIQLPSILYINSLGANVVVIDSLQAPTFVTVGFDLGLQYNSQLLIHINLIAIGLYFLLKYFNVGKPVGSSIILNRQRKGTFPQIQFPVTGTIEKIAGRIKMTAIYQIVLDSEISIKDKTYKYILLEPKDGSLIKLTKQKQVCALRLCNEPNLNFNNQQNPLIDWIIIDVN